MLRSPHIALDLRRDGRRLVAVLTQTGKNFRRVSDRFHIWNIALCELYIANFRCRWIVSNSRRDNPEGRLLDFDFAQALPAQAMLTRHVEANIRGKSMKLPSIAIALAYQGGQATGTATRFLEVAKELVRETQATAAARNT